MTDIESTPVLAIVGRPNVGKSTLFNRLTKSRDALVADVPGLTRDVRSGNGQLGDARYLVLDTGGVDDGSSDVLSAEISAQALEAARGSSHVLLVVDGQGALNSVDQDLSRDLRRQGLAMSLVIRDLLQSFAELT